MSVEDEQLREILEKEEKRRSVQFLKTWKIAVNMIGPALFTVTALSVESATDLRQLRPDMEAIMQYLMEDDTPAHQFLFMVLSFYDFMGIEEIYESTGHMIPRIIDLQFLTDTERMIIYALVEHSDIDEKW